MAGGAHTCLVIRNRDDQAMKCWGDNARGSSDLPYVALGNAHTCALSYAWGNRLGVVQC